MNLFYKLYKGSSAMEGTNAYTGIRVDWWEVPGRDEEWKKREIANLGSIELFEQEYGNKFIASSTLLLSRKTIEFMNRISTAYQWKELYDISLDNDKYQDLKWHPKFDPNKIWDKERFVISIDLADGVGRDYTVFNIFQLEVLSVAKIRKMKNFSEEQDFFRLRQVGRFHSNIKSLEDAAEILEMIIFEVFKPELLTVILEMNFKGNYLVERLSRNPEFYSEIFLHTKHSLKATKLSLGIKLNKDNKQTYTRELKKLMDEKRIIVTCEDTMEELNSFGINEKGSFSGQGMHDDLAMSCVNLVPYFTSTDFYEQVEEIIDFVSENIYKAIYNKMDNIDDNETLQTIKWLNNIK